MPTLMTRPTFDLLVDVRRQLAGGVGPPPPSIDPSYIFVPWAGQQLIAKGRGIYYVGIATNAEEGGSSQSFEGALTDTEEFCRCPTVGYSPFWRFLDRLTRELLNGPYDQTQEWWGWSNLLKVAGSAGSPDTWPLSFSEKQRPASLSAFQEEIGRLRDSLIVVVSAKDYGILDGSVGERDGWDTHVIESTRGKVEVRKLRGPMGNTYLHLPHPNYMRRRGVFDPAVSYVVQNARELRPFN
jgi:hypothetical protein